VLACDADVHAVSRVTSAQQVTLAGGGGTDMRTGIERALALPERPGIVIVITDGFTPWPDEPSSCRLVVALTQADAPATPAWAETVRITETRKGTLPAPELAQVRDEVAGPLVGEEELRAVNLDNLARAREGVPELVSPLDAEGRVPGAPYQLGRSVQHAQRFADPAHLSRHNRGDHPLELLGALRGLAEHRDVGAPHLVGHQLRVLEAGP
jgi:hypothetical protein